jgi:hypothetical protein
MIELPNREGSDENLPTRGRSVRSTVTTTRLLQWGVLLVGLAVTRIPHLRSANFILDQDECVIGLMARHLIEGSHLPLFFYGQWYGLSTLEVGIAALALKLPVPPDYAIKCSMLLLFAGAGILLIEWMRRDVGKAASWYALALFVSCPAWILWSTKARGGYLTALLLSHLTLLLVSGGAGGYLIGALVAVMCLAQPFWVAGLPLLLHATVRQHWSASSYLRALASGIVVVSLVLVLALTDSPRPIGPPIFDVATVGDRLLSIWRDLTTVFRGTHYLYAQDVGPVTAIAGTLWGAATIAFLGVQVLRYHRNSISCVACAGALSCALAVVLTLFIGAERFQPRYLLPLAGFLIIGLTSEMALWKVRRSVAVGAALVLVGLITIPELQGVVHARPSAATLHVNEREAIRELVGVLRSEGVEGAFSFHAALPWQIMFYSDERVVSWARDFMDRFPPHTERFHSLLERNGSIAIVGYSNQWSDFKKAYGEPPKELALHVISNKYFVLSGDQHLIRDVIRTLLGS